MLDAAGIPITMTGMETRSCIVVSDGRRGIENQALGLAEAVGRLTPLQTLPIHVPRTGELPDAGMIEPDLWIGCGRAAVRAASLHRKQWRRTRFVYVQKPRSHADLFDLIIAPRHDRMRGPKVLNILGSPNRITPQRLNEGASTFADRLEALPGPQAAILIGGDSKHHRFTDAACTHLLEEVDTIRRQAGSLMITVSRRTPDTLTRALRERYAQAERVWFHEGDGPNPYFAFLSSADWICVTEDSTNMLCEAAATGAPVYRLGVDGDPGKFRHLYAGLEGAGAVRPYLGRLESWDYEPLHETDRAAQAVLEILT
ncbi:mitochondrial fission ELM1 family protein [Oceanicaulis sp. MMSF_3324]|uniref:mitochondrial fission ELM1 family protein n=1 Tax=Oceanicaulis sp. MMSF_3324 TaxID=3046702 RepID=UPI00273E799A|nr:mitochondrial fission ELM1 family protein [Oceanicaulis sp. MMSF_3324]